jgi:hypothetical protein
MGKYNPKHLEPHKQSVITKEIGKGLKLISVENLSDDSFKEAKAKSSVPYYLRTNNERLKAPIEAIKFRRRTRVNLPSAAINDMIQRDAENRSPDRLQMVRKPTMVLLDKLNTLSEDNSPGLIHSKFKLNKFNSVSRLPILHEEKSSTDSFSSSYDSNPISSYKTMIKRISAKMNEDDSSSFNQGKPIP